jgi:predicted P-loop ATPase
MSQNNQGDWQTSQCQVSLYNNCYTTVSTYVQTMSGIINTIQGDTYRKFVKEDLCAVIEKHGIKSDQYRELKQNLVCFSVYGTYHSIIRQAYDKETGKIPQIQIYNRTGHGDIDGLEIQQALDLRARLSECLFIAWTFISPSQRGVKFGVRTNATLNNHIEHFQQIQEYFSKYLNLPIEKFDLKVKDLSRLCFLSHDPDAFLRETPEVFPFKPSKPSSKSLFNAGNHSSIEPPSNPRKTPKKPLRKPDQAKVSFGYELKLKKRKTIPLSEIYELIRNPNSNQVKKIQELRDAVDQGRYSDVQEQIAKLPYFCCGGVIEIDEDEEEGNQEFITEFSGRLLLEIICKETDRSLENNIRIKQVLSKDPYIEMAAISADNRQILVVLPIYVEDDQDFTKSLRTLISYFDQEYDLGVDDNLSRSTDISPLSHDPHLFINPDVVVFNVEEWNGNPQKTNPLLSFDSFVSDISGTLLWEQKWHDLFDPQSPQGPASGEGRILFDASKHQLPPVSPSFTDQDYKEMLDCISGYEDYFAWLEIGMALKAELGEDGYSFWKYWSKKATNYCGEEELQKKWRSLNPNRITGATLTFKAQDGGWKRSRSKTLPNPQNPTKTESTLSEPAVAEQAADDQGAESSEYTPNLKTIVTKSGETKLVPNLLNVYELFKAKKFSIWFDTFTGKIQAIRGKETLEWSDHQTLRVARHLQSEYAGLERVSRETVDQAVELYAKDHPRNELTDWLTSLKWDGTQRLDTWLIDYCGVEDNVYTREAGRCWLIGAITRAYQPGTQFDHCLVFEGDQGLGKSSLLRTLANGWFQELEDFSGKESAEVLMGTWIVEISELSALKKSDIESVKRFLTAVSDRYRPAYGRHVVDMPRTCVFAGTTNRTEYLKDASGNRRFWPVLCQKIERDAFRKDRDQLLAETVVRFQQGESLLMTEEAIEIAKEQQEERYQPDVWTEPIEDYLNKQMSTTIPDIFSDVLHIDIDRRTRGDEMRIGNILQQLRWRKGKRKQVGGSRNWVYYPPK